MYTVEILVVLAYLAAMGYLSYRGSRQTKTAADYLLAGRNANPVVMALSYGAAFISTSAIIGFGGVSALFGMSLLWLAFLNIFVGVFLAFVFLGGPTRRMGRHLDAHTFPEFLGRRFDSRALQVVCGLVIFVFMPLYAMAVINGVAEVLASTFALHFDVALALVAVIAVVYVLMGGLKGVMLADAMQAGIMLVGMLTLAVVTYSKLGGVVEAHKALSAIPVPDSLKAIGHQGWTSMPKFGWAESGSKSYDMWWTICTTIVMGVGIGVLAQPQLIVRYMTVKSQQSLNRAVAAGGFFILVVIGVTYTVGPLSNVYFRHHESLACKIQDERVLLYPDPAKGGRLAPLPGGAAQELRAQAKEFVSYTLLGGDGTVKHLLKTPAMRIHRGVEGKPDRIEPGLISIARTVGPGVSLSGNRDSVMPEFVTSAMPKWFGALFMLTLLAAGMSTVSSQLHTMGTAIGRDVYERLTGGPARRSMLINRVGVLVGIVVALALGRMAKGNVIAIATAVFFGICAAAFLPAYLGGLFWKGMTRAGALASVAAGLGISLFWLAFVNERVAGALGLSASLFGRPNLLPPGWSRTWLVMDPLLVSLPLSLLVGVLVSLATRPLSREYVAYCFGGPRPGQ